MINDQRTALAKLEGIEALLIVPEGEVLAVAQQSVAVALYEGIKVANSGYGYNPEMHILASQTYVGLSGAIGRVELVKAANEAELLGVVYVPKACVQIAQLMMDEQDYQGFLSESLGDTYEGHVSRPKTDLDKQSATIQDETLRALPFLSGKGYYWTIRRPESYDFYSRSTLAKGVFDDGRPLSEQVGELETVIVGIIKKLDARMNSLDPRAAGTEITPEYAAQRYASMTAGKAIVAPRQGLRLLGSGG